MSIKNLDINPKYCSALLKAHIREINKLFCFSKIEIEKKTGLTENEVAEVLKAAARTCWLAPPITCLDLHWKLSTGCPVIDSQLHGGILSGGITEICGESASGKTQLCIQFCLIVQWPEVCGGQNADSLYICTEDVFPTKRLQQMCNSSLSDHIKPSTDRIFIEHAVDLDTLWELINVRIPTQLLKMNVKLIVIDSIAALIRTEYNHDEIVERAKIISKFASQLHKLSHQFNLCVVCINQVSDVFDEKPNNINRDGSRRVMPALGLTWSYCVNTRIMLSRTQWTASVLSVQDKKQMVVSGYDPIVRSFKVLFAPHLPLSECHFIVDQGGVKDFVCLSKSK